MRLILLLSIFFVQFSYAENDYPNCEKTFFKSGELSTKKCYDKDNRFGKAYAYTKKGKLIYEKGLRKIAGHESVYFTFYPSGAVKKAEWSSAPDAGIQWYNSTDEFAENGTLTSHTENNYDDYLRVVPTYIVPKDTSSKNSTTKYDSVIIKPKQVECWFVNHTYFTISVKVIDKKNKQEINQKNIKAGDSIKVGTYDYTAKNFEPVRKYLFDIQSANNTTEQKPFVKTIKRKRLLNKNDAFYYIIENK